MKAKTEERDEPVPAPPGVRCYKCDSTDVLCVPHPHSRGSWYQWECQSCGHRGGAHRHKRPYGF